MCVCVCVRARAGKNTHTHTHTHIIDEGVVVVGVKVCVWLAVSVLTCECLFMHGDTRMCHGLWRRAQNAYMPTKRACVSLCVFM